MILLPGAIWVGPINPDNYTPTRYGTPVSEIIDHHTDTDTWQQALAAFNAQYPSGGGRSAHLIIDRNDPVNDVYQCVSLGEMAWGAANYAANLRGVNIEHVRPWDSGYQPITPGQYAKSHQVHLQLSAMFGFPLDTDHVRPHSFYWPTTCPGDLDLSRLIQGDAMTPQQEATMNAIAAALGLTPQPDGSWSWGGSATVKQDLQSLWNGVPYQADGTPEPGGVPWPALKLMPGGGAEPSEPKTISLDIPSVPGKATGTLS